MTAFSGSAIATFLLDVALINAGPHRVPKYRMHILSHRASCLKAHIPYVLCLAAGSHPMHWGNGPTTTQGTDGLGSCLTALLLPLLLRKNQRKGRTRTAERGADANDEPAPALPRSCLLNLESLSLDLLSPSRFFLLCEKIPALGPTGKSRSTDKKRAETAKEGSNEGAKYDWLTSTPATNFGLR